MIASERQIEVYKVGGFVRDMLLGKEPSDCDYVVIGETVESMLTLGYKQVGRSFPVFLHPVTHEEYALARTESKSGVKHYEFTTCLTDDLIEDLRRRDITINAIAMSLDGKLIDPFGGMDDIKNKVLRHVSDAFKEDPLRILRIARFASILDFTVADETVKLLLEMSNIQYIISRERVVYELKQALSGKCEIFIAILKKSNHLRYFFPSLEILAQNTEEFISLINHLKSSKTEVEKYQILAIFCKNEEAIHEFSLSKTILKIMKHTQIIYNNLYIYHSPTKLLEVIFTTKALSNELVMIAINGLIFHYQNTEFANTLSLLLKSIELCKAIKINMLLDIYNISKKQIKEQIYNIYLKLINQLY